MSEHFVDLSLPSDFDGSVRLFPLPNTVLFPGVVQSLHIFEPRYRAMMADCLDSDRLLTLAMLHVDQIDDNGNPKLAQVVCIGRVVSEVKLNDGRYNLMLVGAKRAKIIEERMTKKPYRIATVEPVDENLDEFEDAGGLRKLLVTRFRELAEFHSTWNESFLQQLLGEEIPLCRVVDMISYVSGIDPENQQRVLSTFDLRARTKLAIELIGDQLEFVRRTHETRRDFPPKFSLN